jgi:Uma2 family endonuclease
MGALQLEDDTVYTYADYAGWETEDRYELIDGVPFLMAGASSDHQIIAGEIYRQLGNQLKGKPCRPFIAAYDVCLNGKGNWDADVFQPDVLVVCNRSKITKNYLNGAPDFAVEVLSPSTRSKDMILKLKKYYEAGVREYWTVDPDARTVNVHIFNDEYEQRVYNETDVVPIGALPGCAIDMGEVFNEVNSISDSEEEGE